GQRPWYQLARIKPQAHGSAQILNILLLRQKIDNRMRRSRVDLRAVRAFEARKRTRGFNDGYLHAQANSEERDLLFTSITNRRNLALDSPIAEAARHKDTADTLQLLRYVVSGNVLRIHPADFHFRIVIEASMRQRLNNTQVSIMEGYIFANDCNFN